MSQRPSKTNRPLIAWIAGLAALATQSATAAPSWEFAAGTDYSTGRYGADSDTQITDATVGVRMQMNRLRLETLIPAVRVEGPGELINGVLVGTGASSRRSGLGDVGVTGSWLLIQGDAKRPSIEATGSVKLPTAQAGIGTGKTDLSLGANLYQPLTPRLSLFGALGYSWLTDSAAYALSNGVTATAALTFKPKPEDEAGFSVSYRQPVAAGYAAQASVTPYWSHRLSPNVGLSAYLSAGLTSASPRLGGGVAFKIYR